MFNFAQDIKLRTQKTFNVWSEMNLYPTSPFIKMSKINKLINTQWNYSQKFLSRRKYFFFYSRTYLQQEVPREIILVVLVGDKFWGALKIEFFFKLWEIESIFSVTHAYFDRHLPIIPLVSEVGSKMCISPIHNSLWKYFSPIWICIELIFFNKKNRQRKSINNS